MKYFFILVTVILVLVSGCKDTSQKKPDAENESSINLNKVRLSGLNGSQLDLSQYKGKTVFLNFWATWCKPCLQEMPSIKNAMDILKNENIVFLFASDETAEQIERFKNSHDYDFNYVKADNPEELNIMALPTTFIFDKNGNLVFNEMGYRKWDDKTNIDLILNSLK